MGSIDGKWDDDEYSVIGDKGEVGFIDYQEDKSLVIIQMKRVPSSFLFLSPL